MGEDSEKVLQKMLQSVKNSAYLERITVLILFILAKKKPKDELISNAWGRYMIQEDLLNVEIKVQKKTKSQEVEAGTSQDISVLSLDYQPHRSL